MRWQNACHLPEQGNLVTELQGVYRTFLQSNEVARLDAKILNVPLKFNWWLDNSAVDGTAKFYGGRNRLNPNIADLRLSDNLW